MAKKNSLFIVGAFVLVIICLFLFNVFKVRMEKEIPLLHDAAFGQRPAQITRRLGEVVEFQDDIDDTGKTVYTYRTEVLGCDAMVSCFFWKDRRLTELVIRLHESDDDLYDRVYACIRDHYSENKNFFTKEHQNPDRITTGIDDGTAGIFYSIQRTDEFISIQCTKLD